MSIASNATDQQIGEILKAIQDVTPKVIEQAVVYHQFVSEMWLGIFFGVGLALTVVLCRYLLVVRKAGWFDKEGPVLIIVLSGLGIVFCLMGSVVCIDDLVKMTVAPDYYAMECLAKLLGR